VARRRFLSATHEQKVAKFGREAEALIEHGALRQAVELKMANFGKGGMPHHVGHESGSETGGPVHGVNDDVEDKGLEYAV
jgi:hypothetical protein